jgi:phage gpG-like protein
MPIKIDIQGDGTFTRAGERVSASRARLVSQIEGAAKVFGFDAEARIKKDYLSGPRPERLGVRTGRLRSSIAARVSVQGQDIVIQVGTNVEYAATHEFGFRGIVNVPAHDRVVRKAFGRPITAVVAHVMGHPRKVNIRARPFLEPGVRDATPAFEDRIRDIMSSIIEDLDNVE